MMIKREADVTMKIKHLADLPGVLPSTISKVFSGSHEVNESRFEEAGRGY